MDGQEVPLCKHNQNGFCKYRQDCLKKHIEEACLLNQACQYKFCELRHPKTCRTYAAFGKCKFSNCAYLHTKGGTNLKIEILENKVGDLDQKLAQLAEICHNMKLEIEEKN